MIEWPLIDSVLLDMDGTLLDLNFDNHFWQEFVPLHFSRRQGIDLATAKQQLMPRFQAMQGRMEWYCLDYWSRELELDIAGLKVELAGLIDILPHVTDFLDAVRQAGKRLVLVTNAHPKSLGLKMEKTCLHAFFDAIVCAHDLGLPKEDPGFWPALQKVEPFRRAHTLLVDDSLAVLESARCYGIAHLIAVGKPDSQRPPRQIHEFPSIPDFRALMPVV